MTAGPAATVRLSLALQGGGAHGAFTWGVLDRLLEDGRIEVAAVSGTSAGALNAAALKAGLVAGGAAGGREAARARLRRLWEQVVEIGDFRALLPWLQPFLPVARFWQETAQALLPFSPAAVMAQLYSPYAWGSQWANPLAPVIADFDFSQICHREGPALFVGATNVRTGKVKVFAGEEITREAILASACLPSVFQAVEIDGEAYWDGGFTGNPSLWPLYDRALPDDILIVQVNPLRRDSIPQTPIEIENRVNEISFNASLLSELRAIAFVRRLIAEGKVDRGQMKDVRIHMIADDGLMNDLTASSKLQPSGPLVERLFQAGRAAADRFLKECAGKVGTAPTVALEDLLG